MKMNWKIWALCIVMLCSGLFIGRYAFAMSKINPNAKKLNLLIPMPKEFRRDTYFKTKDGYDVMLVSITKTFHEKDKRIDYFIDVRTNAPIEKASSVAYATFKYLGASFSDKYVMGCFSFVIVPRHTWTELYSISNFTVDDETGKVTLCPDKMFITDELGEDWLGDDGYLRTPDATF